MSARDWRLDGALLRLERKDDDDGAFTLLDTPLAEEGAGAREVAGRLLHAESGWVTVRLGGATRRARVLRQGDSVWVGVAGETYRFDVPKRGRGEGSGGGEGRVESPMPGTVLEVMVANGDSVEEDQDLLVVEAMKMEHRLKAGRAGVVQGLSVAAGDKVDAGVALLEVVPAEK